MAAIMGTIATSTFIKVTPTIPVDITVTMAFINKANITITLVFVHSVDLHAYYAQFGCSGSSGYSRNTMTTPTPLMCVSPLITLNPWFL